MSSYLRGNRDNMLKLIFTNADFDMNFYTSVAEMYPSRFGVCHCAEGDKKPAHIGEEGEGEPTDQIVT